jgi:dihydroorotate dehydrogenase
MPYPLLRRALFTLEPERAHDVALAGLDRAGPSLLRRVYGRRVPDAPVQALGLDFPNPVGLAAGLDKNADHIDALGALGFGFIEVGTVTPRPQDGNPRPRLFRLPRHEALINRLGFNNRGVDHLVRRLEGRRYRGIVGVNIGKNRDTPLEQALDDYRHGLERVHPVADYVTVNVSSPNTPGLRTLQSGDALTELLAGLDATRRSLDRASGRRVPLLVKIAPDLDHAEIDALGNAATTHGIDGLIATNTTSSRERVKGAPHAEEEGGLSGAPLLEPSTAVLARLAEGVGDDVTLVGVGGIVDERGASAKFDAGARLVQIYTGLIYRGPSLIRDAVRAARSAA